MLLSPASRPSSARRALAGVAIAALAFTSCGLTTGETAIDATGTEVVTQPTTPPIGAVVPAAQPTTAPVEVPTSAPAPDAAEVVDAATGDESATDTRGERAGTGSEDATTDDVVPVPTEIVVVDDGPAEPEAAAPEAGEPEAGEPEAADEAEAPETASFNQTSVAACMDGVWASQPGQVGAYTAHLAELTGAPMSAAGRITVALENGRYVYDASVTTSINVDGFQTLSVVEGITQGDFTYTNGFIVAEQTFADIVAYVELPDGSRIDAGALGEEFNQMALFHEVPFDCAGGDTITLHFDTLPGTARFPMTFERQP